MQSKKTPSLFFLTTDEKKTKLKIYCLQNKITISEVLDNLLDCFLEKQEKLQKLCGEKGWSNEKG
ncbi:MAG: hypothetical protein QXP36_14295 [Conexivisphaerales archaeon]